MGGIEIKTQSYPMMAAPQSFGVDPVKLSASQKRNENERAKLGEFVGGVFYATLLKQMQSSSIKGAYGHGGRAEETFAGQLTMELSKKMGRSANNPLVDRMEKSIRRQRGEDVE
jgi:hypothetical protein